VERLKGEERKRVLESQLEERQLREFISAEQEAKREKGLVDAILAKIAAEDVAEAAQKARARDDVIKAIADFKEQRERAVAAAAAAEREEQARIAVFHLHGLRAERIALRPLVAEAFALRDRIGVYDAFYAIVARLSEATLLTTDRGRTPINEYRLTCSPPVTLSKRNE
jgi:predicted nucleic acid-binding protein